MISLFSPAKVNLFFRVLRRRPDGYHEIASLYQVVSLKDRLTMELAEEDCLTCDDPSIPCDERNLVLKAVHLFRRKTGSTVRVRVHLEKKIPAQAGLGGGSSNAATALFALRALTRIEVDEAQLAAWSAELGSDISFFFSTGTAFCHSRGELFINMPSLVQTGGVIVKPQEGLSTPEVFKLCRPERFEPRDADVCLKRALSGQLELFNDLEDSAFSLLPTLSHLKSSLLAQGYSQVTMTGSGTAFFCLVPDHEILYHCDRVKAPGLRPSKRGVVLSSIQPPFSMAQPRELSRGRNGKDFRGRALGSAPSLTIPGAHVFPVDFLQREPEQWYN